MDANANSFIPENAFLVAFSAVYFFAFRESTKLLGTWRAFHWRSNRELMFKIVFCSGPLLLLGPVLLYVALYKLLAGLIAVVQPLTLAWKILLAIFAIVLGIVPRALKNTWALIASFQSERANRQAASADREWLWSSKDDFPLDRYAWQVVIFLGLLPLGLAAWIWRLNRTSISIAVTPEDVYKIFVLLYSAELVVFFHMARLRGLVHKVRPPRNLMNRRLALTFTLDVFLPILFGLMCLVAFRTALTSHVRLLWIVIACIPTCPFPYYASTTLHYFARLLGWDEAEEVKQGISPVWYVLNVVAFGVLLGLALCFSFHGSQVIRSAIEDGSRWMSQPR